MEEILASIRRIIADDQAGKPAAAPADVAENTPPKPAPIVQSPRPAPVSVAADDDVLDLQPKAVERPPRVQEPHYIADDPVGNDLSFEEPPPRIETPVAPPPAANAQDDIDAMMAEMEFAPSPAPLVVDTPAPAERLVSPSTDRMVSGAFGSLANTILSKNARTLEDLMQDMMRPMIKDWLDDHLPLIVERLVRAEIERVARGGR
ncbi:MAG: DUF2497 domain-containing protein [Beijerinckiaceae bacterium]